MDTWPADFAASLQGQGRHDWTSWLILCDLLEDVDRPEDAATLRKAILAKQVPDQLLTDSEYILVVPFTGDGFGDRPIIRLPLRQP